MNIGIVIARIGGLDGVSLETEKWIDVLQDDGHKIFVLTGDIEIDRPLNLESNNILQIDELSLYNSLCVKEQILAFQKDSIKSDKLFDLIEKNSATIMDSIVEWVDENELDILIAENTVSLPSHISLGFGIHSAVMDLDIPIICHHHDLAWDKGHRFISEHNEVNHFIKHIFPLQDDNAVHVTINTFAKQQFATKLGIDAYYIPNVVNFNKTFGERTNASIELRKELGLNKSDVALFQVSKIVRRKGIETAIELISKIPDKKVKLVITGTYTDDEKKNYFDELVILVNKLNLEDRVIFGYDIVKNYTLSDIYGAADICTYFSKYEGFGNTFIEAVHAKKPIFVNDYKPVFLKDIASKGFITMMITDNEITEDAFNQMISIIENPNLREAIGEDNFEIGKKYFSYDVLKRRLQIIFNELFGGDTNHE